MALNMKNDCYAKLPQHRLLSPPPLQEERMLVVVLIAIVVLFVVCTTPAAFLSVLVSEDLKSRPWFALFRACANDLELLCFALNFFVYCLCSADIRGAFVDVLFNNAAVAYLRRKSLGGGNGQVKFLFPNTFCISKTVYFCRSLPVADWRCRPWARMAKTSKELCFI